MSIFQYYEFQAIDRPLTPQEQQAVAALSSRVDPHPWRTVFLYHWSDFPRDAEDVLAQYYDAMLYFADWGIRKLMFRFPASLINQTQAQAYCLPLIVEEYVSFSVRDAKVVLNIEFHDENGREPIDGVGWLDVLIPLRDDILRGDYRALYLAWLKVVQVEDMLDSVLEPPLPPGLRELSPALRKLIAFFDIDSRLVQAAAQASPPQTSVSDGFLRSAISQLSREERDAFLLRLARGEPHLSIAFQNRLQGVAAESTPGQDAASSLQNRRTVGQLLSGASRMG